MTTSRQEALVELLAHASQPVTGEELATQLGVTSRTIRSDVRALNTNGPVVRPTRAGYVLAAGAQEKLATIAANLTTADTPAKRLADVCRILVQSPSPVSVYQLAAKLYVSDYTIESDLARARELLRSFDLRLSRSQDLVRVTGPERGRRQLVRQLLYGAGRTLVPATWQALISEFSNIDVRSLGAGVQRILEHSGRELHEYAVSDIVLHLVVTVDRVQHGHVVQEADAPAMRHEPAVEEAVRELAEVVADVTNVELPPAELDVLYNVLAVRQLVAADTDASAAIDPHVKEMVIDVLDVLSSKYFLTVSSAGSKAALNLALHVQGVIARHASGTPHPHALGESFRTSHPMLYDLALDFALELERRTGMRIAGSEFDYLALHLAMYYLPSFTDRDLVTVTLVTPRFYEMSDFLAEQLRSTVKEFAIVEAVASAIDFNSAETTSDVIVTTVPLGVAIPVPVVLINPLPTSDDLMRIIATVRSEHDRTVRRRIRSTLSALIDPMLFVHSEAPLTQYEALALLTDRLQAAGYTDDNFLDDVLDRESRSSTAFGGSFAIPHSMRMDAHASAIAALICDAGIPWGDSRVKLVLLFALSPDGRQTFRDVLDEVTRMLAQGYRVAELIRAGSHAEQFVATFMDILDEEAPHTSLP